MRPVQNAGGHVGLTAREYPIAAATAIARGQMVQLSGGYVVSAVAAQTGALLGVAAEDHPGTEDVLNARANGTVILVYDNPELIFECRAPQIHASASGSSATVIAAAAGEVAAAMADDAFNGGCVKLRSKAAGSTNTDVVGQLRAVTDYTAATRAFTVPSGGSACDGDVYEVYPPIGSTVCALDGAGLSKAVISATGATALRVVAWDTDRGCLRLMAAKHALAVDI